MPCFCHIHLPVCLWIMDPYSRAPKKNTNHGNEVRPQDTRHLIQRPCYQRGSPCQDPAGNWTTWRPPYYRAGGEIKVSCSLGLLNHQRFFLFLFFLKHSGSVVLQIMCCHHSIETQEINICVCMRIHSFKQNTSKSSSHLYRQLSLNTFRSLSHYMVFISY